MPTKEAIRPRRNPLVERFVGRPSTEPTVYIDHPGEGEKVLTGHYAVRIGVDRSNCAELSINGGDWVPCRKSVGYFWYDWWPNKSGSYRLVVRAKLQDGSTIKSPVRTFTVVNRNVN